MVLHGHFCRVFHLIQVLLVKLRQSGGSHGAGGADLRLAAGLRAGDGRVPLGQIADDAGSGQAPADLLVGIALGHLGVFQHRGKHAAGTAGGSGDYRTVSGVLLRHSIGEGSDQLEFPKGRLIHGQLLAIQILGFPLDIQAAGEGALRLKAFIDRILHDLPDLHQEVPDLRSFVQLHIFGYGMDVAPFAEIRDLREGVLDIHFLSFFGGLPRVADITAADGLHTQLPDLDIPGEGGKVQKWENGMSVPDSSMLIMLADELDSTVSELLGEPIVEPTIDDLKILSEKLEVINLQLAKRSLTKVKTIRWILISLCAVIAIIFIALAFMNSSYLDWNYNDPELAVAGTIMHGFEFLFVRLAPIAFFASVVGIVVTYKKR